MYHVTLPQVGLGAPKRLTGTAESESGSGRAVQRYSGTAVERYSTCSARGQTAAGQRTLTLSTFRMIWPHTAF
jgi:hypothetical protein